MYIDKAIINYSGMPIEVQVDCEFLTLVRKESINADSPIDSQFGMTVDELRDVIELCALMGWEGVKSA